MNNLSISRKNWAVLSIVAVISVIVYIIVQVVASLDIDFSSENNRPYNKKAAIEQATLFAEQQTGLSVIRAELYHDSNKDYTGYVDKYELLAEHHNTFEKYLPFNQYRINVQFNNKIIGSVFMNLFTGDIIGWKFNLNGELAEQTDAFQAIEAAVGKLGFPVDQNTHIDFYESVKQAEGLGSLTNPSSTLSTGYYVSHDSLALKDAVFQYDTSVIVYNDKAFVNELLPTFMLPSDYEDNVKRQDKYALIWTIGGYGFFTFVLGVLAIIYSILYRRHTSFKYGAWFTAISFVLSSIINMGSFKSAFGLSGQMLSALDTFELIFDIIFVAFSVLFGIVGYYFSFVAGDGLWKAQGFRLWPRFADRDYGMHVWNSMKVAYLLAIIGIGMQSVIFLILTSILGTWQANDTEQSPLNFQFTWLYPALAWFAGITEEVVYRYFGVGIFRRWFKNTWIAALIPSIIWAAGHTMYPLYPATTRIIELIIVGYFFTWIMIRFGFIAGIFTHAIFNTILMGLTLLFYGETIDIVSSCFFLVLPVLIALVIRWIHASKQRKKDTENFNRPQYPPVMP